MFKFYNKNVVQEDEVWAVLDKSKDFGWSWCRDKAEPFRHTAIVLYFSQRPHFTINFRTEDGANKAECAFSEARPLITIELIADTDYECFPPFEEHSVATPFGKQRAKNRIRAIISFDPGSYNLFINNCRDHVKGVVKHILGRDIEHKHFRQGMAETRSQDAVKEVGALSGVVLTMGAAAWCVSKMFGSKEEEDKA